MSCDTSTKATETLVYTKLFDTEEFNVTQKIKVILFHLQFCTLQDPKLSVQILQIAVKYDGKKNSFSLNCT